MSLLTCNTNNSNVCSKKKDNANAQPKILMNENLLNKKTERVLTIIMMIVLLTKNYHLKHGQILNHFHILR